MNEATSWMKPATITSGRFIDCSWTTRASRQRLTPKQVQAELTALPADNGKVNTIRSPGQTVLSLLQPLELHRQLTLADFVIGEGLQVTSETELLHNPDEPLGRVILVPLDGVTVVHGELVVEVVVTFTDSDESSDHVVARSVLVIEGSLAEPVSERVNAESRLMK